MTKKYTMEITYKNSNEIMKTVNSDSLKYIVKMWNEFFLTSTGERTTRLLDHTWKVVSNENGKDITDEFKLMAWDEK
jgi:hypothetical protein